MVQIKIKGLADGVHVYGEFDDEQAFLEDLQKRLKPFLNHEGSVEAFFHVRTLSEEGFLRFFQICNEAQVFVKALQETKEKPILQRYGTLFNGETLHLKQDTLWIGNLKKGSYVSCEGNLYVIGEVDGVVDLWYAHTRLIASSIDAQVRICDTGFHNMTSFAPSKVYYCNREVLLEPIKEERYGRGHSSCVR